MTFEGDKAFGPLNGRLTVSYTAASGKSSVVVPLSGQVVGDLRYPRRVYFRKVGDTYRSEQVLVASRSKKAVRILSGKDPEGRIAVKVLATKDGSARVELAVTDPKKGKTMRGEIQLKTNDPLEPTVTIPYNLQVAYRRQTGSRSSQRIESKGK